MTPRRPVGRVTLRDIGDAVGVSAKTVSNVVNGQGWVSEPVREKILRAIDELGYRPNLAARQLRNGNSGMIALVVPNLREPYFAEFASSFVSVAQDRDLTVLVSQTGGDRDREIAAIEGNSLPGLDGIVLSPLALCAQDLHERRSSAPLILIGEYGQFLDEGNVTHVGIDNVVAAQAATEHLISQGCRNIAVVGYQHDQSQATSRLRFQGYRKALELGGLQFDPRLIASVGRFNRGEASQAVRGLLDSGVQFDGLFCFSDSMAFGALHTLVAAKISVPEDVRVIGFDNIEEGRFSIPPFDTVDPGADYASRIILDLLGDKGATKVGAKNMVSPEGYRHFEVPFQIVSRAV